MPRIHIIGRKNSGKTTLIVELVRELTARGLKVGTVKHTHHHHELDTPGKDSYRHREAGAAAVGILAPAMNAVFWPAHPGEVKENRYEQFDALLADCDIVLVEGHSQVEGIRIEVWRAENGQEPFCGSDSGIRAVVSDDSVPVSAEVWARSDVAAIADRLITVAQTES